MSKRSLKLLCCVPLFVLLLGAPALVGAIPAASAPPLVGATPAARANTWRWIGTFADTNWTNCDNWNSVMIPMGECYPADAGDDVRFPVHSGGWGTVTMDFTSQTIDDLTVEEDVDFAHTSTSSTLQCQTLIVSGGVTVTWSSGAVFRDIND